MIARNVSLRLLQTFVTGLLLCGCVPAQGLEFTGFYSLQLLGEVGPPDQARAADPRERFPHVRLRLMVDVVNHGSADVPAASLELEDGIVRGKQRASIPLSGLKSRNHARVEHTVVVPKSDYEHWLKGGSPELYVARGGGSQATRARVLLTRLPRGGEAVK